MGRKTKEARVRAVVRGFVQGVGYRQKAQELAVKLGLDGRVRHAGDGVMEVEAEGPREKLEVLVEWLHYGPPVAHVDTVEAKWSTAKGGFRGFAIGKDGSRR